jgi:hypothetical protein
MPHKIRWLFECFITERAFVKSSVIYKSLFNFYVLSEKEKKRKKENEREMSCAECRSWSKLSSPFNY